MSALAEQLMDRYYADSPHPYKLFDRAVEARLGADTVLLDAGCGRTVPLLRKYLGRVRRLIGVELVAFTDVPGGIETYNADLAHLPLPDGRAWGSSGGFERGGWHLVVASRLSTTNCSLTPHLTPPPALPWRATRRITRSSFSSVSFPCGAGSGPAASSPRAPA